MPISIQICTTRWAGRAAQSGLCLQLCETFLLAPLYAALLEGERADLWIASGGNTLIPRRTDCTRSSFARHDCRETWADDTPVGCKAQQPLALRVHHRLQAFAQVARPGPQLKFSLIQRPHEIPTKLGMEGRELHLRYQVVGAGKIPSALLVVEVAGSEAARR